MSCKVSLILVLGLPGVGKTTLCKNLVSKYSDQTIRLVRVSFDDLLDEEHKEFVPGEWKSERKSILDLVDSLIEGILNGEETTATKILLSENQSETEKYVLLLDDNFYYSSMRYEYYQIARKHQTGFLQVVLECDLETALTQNKQRTSSVPDEIITKMFNRFEMPHSSKENWENSTISISNEIVSKYDYIYYFIMKSFDSPVQLLELNTEQSEASRVACSRNVIHQTDLILRKLVSEKMKKEKLSGKNLPDYYKRLDSHKQTILHNLNSGSLKLPSCLYKADLTEESKVVLLQFISDHFNAML